MLAHTYQPLLGALRCPESLPKLTSMLYPLYLRAWHRFVLAPQIATCQGAKQRHDKETSIS